MTATQAAAGADAVVPSVSAHRLKQNRSDYFLVDIREADEIAEKSLPSNVKADAEVTLGAICRDAVGSLLATKITTTTVDEKKNKTLVLICSSGKRAELAARTILLQSPTTSVAVLQRGMVGLENVAAVSPEFLVVLGVGGEDSTEKLSLSLAAVANATDTYESVVLVLMSEGIQWFVKPDSPNSKAGAVATNNVECVVQGEPFKPCKAMLKKFLTNGGLVLACTTCVKHRGLSFEADMMDCVKPMQMPDLVRMLGEAKGGSLQFL